MTRFTPSLDNFAFEIRYSSGHLYLDRCGQTLIDIEQECDGWMTGDVSPNSGNLERPDKWYGLSFNNHHFVFVSNRAYKNNIEDTADECSKIWKIIQANLGIDNYIRVGFRLHYILATESIEESEILLKNSDFNVKLPENIKEPDYEIKTRQIVVIVKKGNVEYRIELSGVTRMEALPPTDIMKVNPKTLSRNQRKFRLARLNQLKEYSANPMYGVHLDIDCVEMEPIAVSPTNYIVEKSKIVKEEFYPILEKIC